MSKRMYIGVSNTARRVTKAYVGVGGVAHRVKKAYIGIGGVARPCMSADPVEYFGEITGISPARQNLGAASTLNYALFAGGRSGSGTTECLTVDAYDVSLTHINAPNLLRPTAGINYYTAGGSTNMPMCQRAVFFSGRDNTIYTDTLTATVVSVQLMKSSVEYCSVVNKCETAYDTLICLNDGYKSGVATYGNGISTIDALTGTTSMGLVTGIDVTRSDMGGAQIITQDSHYNILVGGVQLTACYNSGVVLNANGTRLADVSVPRGGDTTGIPMGDKALFIDSGSKGNIKPSSGTTGTMSVTVFDSALTKTLLDDISVESTSYLNSDGYCVNGRAVVVVSGCHLYTFDKNLTRQLIMDESTTKCYNLMTRVGDFALYHNTTGIGANASNIYAVKVEKETQS